MNDETFENRRNNKSRSNNRTNQSAGNSDKNSIGNNKLPVGYRPANYRNVVVGDQNKPTRARARDIVVNRSGDIEEQAKTNKQRLGEKLVSRGIITENQLNVALEEKKMSGKMLGNIMVELGFINEEVLVSILSEDTGHKIFDPKTTVIDSDVLKYVSKSEATKMQVLPLAIDEDRNAYIAMVDPYDVVITDNLRKLFPRDVILQPVIASQGDILESIDSAYGYSSSIPEIIKELEGNDKVDLIELTG